MASDRRKPRLPTSIAERSHGVLSLDELRRHGMSDHAVEHAVASGELLRVARAWFVVAGSPDSSERRALLATRVLRGGLCHTSAVAWWGPPGFDLEPLRVMRVRPGSTAPADLAILHRPVRLLPHHLTEWRGVTVTRPSRTLFDLAATEHPLRVERAYDTMWARGLVTQQSMERMLRDLAGRGRPGIALMRRLIVARRELKQPAGSRLERRFEDLNHRAGIPMLRRQVQVGDEEGWVGRMDFVGEERRLVVEIDSDIHHAALMDRERDDAITARLEAAGWVVCRWDEDDLWFRAPRVVRELRDAWFRAPPNPRPNRVR